MKNKQNHVTEYYNMYDPSYLLKKTQHYLSLGLCGSRTERVMVWLLVKARSRVQGMQKAADWLFHYHTDVSLSFPSFPSKDL